MIVQPGMLCVGYYFEKYRALSSGIALCGSSVGALCLSPLCAYLTDTYSWQMTMRIQSGLIFIPLVSAIAYRQLLPTAVPVTQEMLKEIVKSMPKFFFKISCKLKFPIKDHVSATSRAEIVQLYETKSMITIDLGNDKSKEEQQFPKISIISRFPLSTVKEKDEDRCKRRCLQILLCKWFTEKNENALTPTSKTYVPGPLDRKDIFYSASLMLLPEYTKDRSDKRLKSTKTQFSYHISMIRNKDFLSTIQIPSESSVNDEETIPRFRFLDMIKKAFRLLFDVSLLKSPVFCAIALTCLFYAFAWFIPYHFMSSK